MALIAALIVKNEAKVIARCLESVVGLVDSFLVVDTGSTDNTDVVIRGVTRETGLTGIIRSEQWVNFGHNRTKLLELARTIYKPDDWLLLLDADRTAEYTTPEPFATGKDAGMVTVHEAGVDFQVPLLLRVGKPWRYEMPTHEYLECDEPYGKFDVHGLTITSHNDGGSREDKLQRDVELLKQELEENPDNARAVFYLAQTWRGLGELDKAITMYGYRLSQEGFWEEAWYSMWCRGELLLERNWNHGVATLLAAYEMNPVRAEPLHTLAWAYRLKDKPNIAAIYAERASKIPEPEGFFVHHAVYDHLALYEYGISLQQSGDFTKAHEVNEKLLSKEIPGWVRETITSNMEKIA